MPGGGHYWSLPCNAPGDTPAWWATCTSLLQTPWTVLSQTCHQLHFWKLWTHSFLHLFLKPCTANIKYQQLLQRKRAAQGSSEFSWQRSYQDRKQKRVSKRQRSAQAWAQWTLVKAKSREAKQQRSEGRNKCPGDDIGLLFLLLGREASWSSLITTCGMISSFNHRPDGRRKKSRQHRNKARE